jgi:hypothetical protein
MEQNLEHNPELTNRIDVMNTFVSSQVVDEDLGKGKSRREISIDDLVDREQVPPPNFVKIDVEGGELQVLKGMRNTLISCLHSRSLCLIVEVHSPELELNCTKYLAELGYVVDLIPNARWRLIWPEFRPIGHDRWIIANPGRPLAAIGN